MKQAPADQPISYAGYRFPPKVISYALWLYNRFPLSLRMVRSNAPACGDKWHLDEVVITMNDRHHWLWRTVDEDGLVLDILVQSRRDRHAAQQFMRKLLRKHGRTPHVLITDKLKSCAAANQDMGLATFEITVPVAAVLVGPRSGGQPVQELPLQARCQTETEFTCQGIRSLERGDVRHEGSSMKSACAITPLTSARRQQVDNTVLTNASFL